MWGRIWIKGRNTEVTRIIVGWREVSYILQKCNSLWHGWQKV